MWSDPLFSHGDRFPLGASNGFPSDRYDEPSGPESRPFSLRGVVTGARIDTPATVTYHYCPQRQTTTVQDADGNVVRLAEHTKPGATPGSTTGTTDGQPGQAPPEEVGSPDHQTD
ncbi:MAG: putative ATP-grasp-modified RiPP [Pseudonocardiaceae bacterium]